MNKKKISIVISIVICLLLLFIIAYLSSYSYILLIKDEIQDRIVITKKVKPSQEFATLIKHSVQKTPVYEFYRIEEDQTLTVTRTKLQDLGWGMPSVLEREVVFKDGFMIMDGINRNLDILHFRVNYIAEPKLIIGDEEIDLKAYIKNNDKICIYIKKIKKIDYLLGVK